MEGEAKWGQERPSGVVRKRALVDAHVEVGELEVVLVGLSTKIPSVREAVSKMFSKQPKRGVDPDEAVALGLAMQAAVLRGDLKDMILLDVTPLIDLRMWNDRGIVSLEGDLLTILDEMSCAFEMRTVQAMMPTSSAEDLFVDKDKSAHTEDRAPLFGGQEVPLTPDVYVSYAWGDDKTTEGRSREEVVDRMCEVLGKSGRKVGRDRSRMKAGDPIEAFADEIAKVPRIIAVIGEKFLHSKYCMVDEIYSAYQRVGFRRLEFQVKVIALVMDDALDMLDAVKDVVMPRGFDTIVSGGFKEVLDRLSPKE